MPDTTPDATHATDRVGPKLSAALRAQASGLEAQGSGPPAPSAAPRGQARRGTPGLPAWAVVVIAVVLGALAGGLAGVISTW